MADATIFAVLDPMSMEQASLEWAEQIALAYKNGGRQMLEELFPGFVESMLAGGALELDKLTFQRNPLPTAPIRPFT